jgi:hypothetical protein
VVIVQSQQVFRDGIEDSLYSQVHTGTCAIMGPRFIVADYTRLHIAARSSGPWLIAVELAARRRVWALFAEVLCEAAESVLRTADIQRTLGAGHNCIDPALGVGTTVAPTSVIGRFPVGTTSLALLTPLREDNIEIVPPLHSCSNLSFSSNMHPVVNK